MVPDDTVSFDRDEMTWFIIEICPGESVTRVSGNRLTLSELVELKTMVISSVPPVNSNIPIHFMLRKLG